MDFWDGWKQLSIISQAFSKPEPGSLDGPHWQRDLPLPPMSGRESVYSSFGYGYSTGASFTDQTLVFEALALCSPLKDLLVEEMHDRSKITRWLEAVDETKKLRITSLDQLETDREYKTEQGTPIKRLPTNELDLAGKILLKILPHRQEAQPGLTVLKAYFAEGTGRIAIESFSLLKFDEGIGFVQHRKDIAADHVDAQDVFMVFSLEEIPLDQKYFLAPRQRQGTGEVEAGERHIKIKRISARDVYISYRHKELVLGAKAAAQARSGALGQMVGVLSRDLKPNFHVVNLAGTHSLGLAAVRKKIDFNALADSSSSSASSVTSSSSLSSSSSPVGAKRKLDDKENQQNGAAATSCGSPVSSGSPAKRAKASPLRARAESAAAGSSPLASSVAPPSSSSSAGLAHAPARVTRKPRPSVSVGGLLDLLPTPPGSPSAGPVAAPPAQRLSSSQPSSSSMKDSSSSATTLASAKKPPAAATATLAPRRELPKAKPAVKALGSATQGLKDLFGPPASAAPPSAGESGRAPNGASAPGSGHPQPHQGHPGSLLAAGGLTSMPFAYIPYANIDPSTLAAKAAGGFVPIGAAPLPPPPPPPPMPTSVADKGSGRSLRKKMRTLHWSIIPKDKLNDTVWKAPEMVDSPSIDLDTTELESMFSLSPDKSTGGPEIQRKRGGIRVKKQSPLVDLLNLQRINNIGILLSQFKLPLEEIVSSIWRMDEAVLSLENLKALRYIAPKEDEIKILKALADKLDVEQLTKAERFLLMLVEVPRLSQRLESFLWKRQFPALLAELAADTARLFMACNEVKQSKKLPQILKIVLTIGQVLNRDSYLFNSDGFKLESLLRLTETKGKNSNFTILHFLKKEVQTKKEHLLSFYEELPHVERASQLCMEHIMLEVQKIKKDLAQIERELTLRKEQELHTTESPSSDPSEQRNHEDRYSEVMRAFYEDAKQQFDRLAGQVDSVLGRWKELARFYGEDPEKTPPQQFFSCLHHFAKQFHSLHLPASFLESKSK